MYESFDDLTTVRKQHFVEWFCGNALNTDRWGTVQPSGGSFTATMADEEDGGLVLKSPTSAYRAGAIGFCNNATNNIANSSKPFSHTGSVCIIVAKFDTYSDYTNGDGSFIGFAEDTNMSAGGNNTLMVGVKGNESKFILQTTNGSGSQTRQWQSPMVTADTNYHVWKLENFMDDATQKARMYMDGTLIHTTTNTLPEGKMGICMNALGDGTNEAKTHIRYFEAYNT